jgi:MFS transporter, DHA1 family, tetracycline resistance protein
LKVFDLLRVLYPIIILNTLSVGMLWPSIPAILEVPFDGDVDAAAALTSRIHALNAILDFISNPIIGSLSDRYGRKPFLLQSLLVSSVCYAAIAIVATPTTVVWTKIAIGICNVSKAMIYAMVVDVMNTTSAPQPARVKVFGLVGVASGCGFALGPAVGGMIGFFLSPRVAVFAASLVVGASALLVYFKLHETRCDGENACVTSSRSFEVCSPMKHTALIGRNRIIAGFAVPFLLSGVAAGPYTIWYFYTEKKYGWSYGTNSLFLAGYGAASVISQGVLLPLLTPRMLSEFATVALGFLANSAVFFLYGALSARSGSLNFALLPLCMLGSLSEPVLRHVLSQVAPAGEQGALQGLLAALSTLANALGPLLASALLATASVHCDAQQDRAGRGLSCAWMLGAPFFVSSALFVLSAAK